MAVIALASASGAPGVTTTAVALALVWPRPVLLVEADPSHGSAVLAGYLRGAVAPEGRSLLGLAKALRQGRLEQAIDEQTVPLDADGVRRLLPSVPLPEQAPALEALWVPLAQALAARANGGTDVIVDAGRLGAAHGPTALLHHADVVLLTTRTHLPAVAAARARSAALTPSPPADAADRTGVPPLSTDSVPSRAGLLVIGEGRPYTGAEISEVTGLPVVASVAWDEAAAGVLAYGSPRPRRWEASTYIRSIGAAADRIQRRASRPTAAAAGAAPARGWQRG